MEGGCRAFGAIRLSPIAPYGPTFPSALSELSILSPEFLSPEFRPGIPPRNSAPEFRRRRKPSLRRRQEPFVRNGGAFMATYGLFQLRLGGAFETVHDIDVSRSSIRSIEQRSFKGWAFVT
jgi:hypothetical protein